MNWIPLVLIFGFQLSWVLGSVAIFRHSQNWAALLAVSGASLGLLTMVALSIFQHLLFQKFNALSTSFEAGVEIERLEKWSGFVYHGHLLGLALFSVGFVGLSLKFGSALRRAKELETFAGALVERVESGEGHDA